MTVSLKVIRKSISRGTMIKLWNSKAICLMQGLKTIISPKNWRIQIGGMRAIITIILWAQHMRLKIGKSWRKSTQLKMRQKVKSMSWGCRPKLEQLWDSHSIWNWTRMRFLSMLRKTQYKQLIFEHLKLKIQYWWKTIRNQWT